MSPRIAAEEFTELRAILYRVFQLSPPFARARFLALIGEAARTDILFTIMRYPIQRTVGTKNRAKLFTGYIMAGGF